MYQTNNKQTRTVRKETRTLADRKPSKKYKSSTNTTNKIDSRLPTKLHSKLRYNSHKFYTFVGHSLETKSKFQSKEDLNIITKTKRMNVCIRSN